MLKNKPPALCNMVKDKAIGAQKNFADTFNWITSLCDALTEYPGVAVREMEVVKDVQYDSETNQLKVFKETAYVIVIPNRSSGDGDSIELPNIEVSGSVVTSTSYNATDHQLVNHMGKLSSEGHKITLEDDGDSVITTAVPES